MIINHNLGAMNANRNMNINASNASKSMEKLSSGLRINRAGDDAAGLAISEKMRGQIRGLDQASSNAQDGISMIQTGEGALNETTSILQRMRELSVQGASDTNDPNSRNAIQTEMDQLTNEVNRIGNTTEFNTQKLLNGGGTEVKVSTTTAGITAGTPLPANGTVSTPVNVAGKALGTGVATKTAGAAGTGAVGTIVDVAAVIGTSAGSTSFTISTALTAGDKINVGGKIITAYKDAAALTASGDSYGIDISAATNTGNDATKQATKIAAMSFGANIAAADGGSGKVTLTQQANDGVGDITSAVVINHGASVTVKITTALSAGDTLTLGGRTITAYKDAAAKTAANGGNGDANGILVGTATAEATAITALFATDSKLTATDDLAGGVTIQQKVNTIGVVTDGTVTQKAAVTGSTTFTISKALTAGETMTLNGKTITAYKDNAAFLASGSDAYGIDLSVSTDAVAQTTAIKGMDFGTDFAATGTGAEIILAQVVAGTGTITAPVVKGAPGPAVAGEYNFNATAQKAGDKITIDGQALTFAAGGDASQSAAELKNLIAGNATLAAKYTVTGTDANVVLTQNTGSESPTASVVAAGDTTLGFSATLQIGANNGQSFTVNIADMRSVALGISSTAAGTANGVKADGTVDTAGATFNTTAKVTDGTTATAVEHSLDITTNANATKAVQVVDDAINRVSAERSKLGASQNRLEHTIANLGTSSENLTSAESRIRDVDMAKEMSIFSKNNILNQAAQAMLAQANQQPQQVLQLLR